MKYIISESRLNQLAFKYLDMNYGHLKPHKPNSNIGSDYVQFMDEDGRVYMDGIIGQELIVDDRMMKDVCDMFSLNEFYFSALIQVWTEKRFGMSWDNNIAIERI